MKKPLVSITFMFKDSGPILDELLSRIASQKTSYSFEIVAAYFGKGKDNSLQKVKAVASKVKIIRPEKFDYGAARDLLCDISAGKYIIALSVDALPANNKWLQNIIDPLAKDKAAVLHAHSYRKIKPLFYRCSNEGLGWRDVGES